jgi:hypothetical protein
LWLVDSNFDERLARFDVSVASMAKVAKQDCDLVFIVNDAERSRAPDVLRIHAMRSHTLLLDKNYYDIAVHFCTLWWAIERGAEYMVWLYDDFVVYDETFISDCESFMDANPDVKCIRIPEYKYNAFYDTRCVSKVINPEAVWHKDAAGMVELQHTNAGKHGTHEFYRSNWRPNSRPMLWRTSAFNACVAGIDRSPVMQPFERHLNSWADTTYDSYVSGYIDGGVCKTFPWNTSCRTLTDSAKWENVVVDVSEMKGAFSRACTTTS